MAEQRDRSTPPETMQAAWYEVTGPADQVMRSGKMARPEPDIGEVLIEIAASGVNPHDVKKRSGWLGSSLPAATIVPHSDGAGTVVAVGPGVPAARLGERVFVVGAGMTRPGEGSAAGYLRLPTDQAIPLPAALSFTEGAALGVPAYTAFLAVLADGPVTGRTILIQGGAGAVGRVMVELARWNGARVIATVSSDEKAAIATQAGADHVINFRSEDVTARVLALTDDVGVDRIVEVDFGANCTVDAACLKPHGIVASYSSTSEREPRLPYYAFALKGATLQFVQASNMQADMRRRATRCITALLGRGQLRPHIAERLPLAEIVRAHELMESGSVQGNIVIEL